MRSVLFIGNSHTYYHEMPHMVVQLADAAGQASGLTVEQSTASGVSLKWHWNYRRTRALIARGGWDAVVLQERSGGPLEDQTTMHEYARRLHDAITEQDAETVFYMTWNRTYQPGTQSTITAAYEDIARELDATLAPVGVAWKRALATRPGLQLHAPDGRHAAPSGSYLAACVFYTVLFDDDPTDLPTTLTVDGTTVVDLSPKRATFLQQTARAAVDAYAS